MKKIMEKGFTLVELLVTIVLLGVVGGVIIYNMTGLSSSSKDKEYEKYVASVQSAAATYADLHKEVTDQLYNDKAFIYIKTEDLIHGGFLSEQLKNPYTNEFINPNEVVKASLDSNTGAIVYEYPVNVTGGKKETFMSALSDYVISGEPFNCMEGVGTYELALADENGDLILDPHGEASLLEYYKNHYGLQCEVPDNFQVVTKSGFQEYINRTAGVSLDPSQANDIYNKIAGGNYYWATKKATGQEFVYGTFDIKYTWVADSGIRKSATRTLRVLEPAQAKLHFIQPYTEYDAKYEGNSWDNPNKIAVQELKWDNTQYVPLKYTVSIEGADSDTYFNVSTTSCGTKGGTCQEESKYKYDVKNATQMQEFVVDDGIKEYKYDFNIKGHHLTGYRYSASTSYVLGVTYKPEVNFIQTKRNDSGEAFENSDGSAKYVNASGTYIDLWSSSRDAIISGVDHPNVTARDTASIENAFKGHIYSPSGISKILYAGVASINDTPSENTYKSGEGYFASHVSSIKNTSGNIVMTVDGLKEPIATRMPYIKIKTINVNGFESEWSDAVPIYVSNYLNDVTGSKCANSTRCDSITAVSTKDSVGCDIKGGESYGKYKKNTYSIRKTSDIDGYITFDGINKFIVSRTAPEGGKTTIVDAGHSVDYSSGNIYVTTSWGVQTCDGWYSTSYQYVNVNYSDDYTMANNRCKSIAPIEENSKLFCSIAGGVNTSYVGYVFSGTAKNLGYAAKDDVCLWDNKSYQSKGSSTISHGSTWEREYTNNYQYAFRFDGNKASNVKESRCSTKCYLDVAPIAYITGGNGSSSSPYKVTF